jgi:hypothetical protein
MRALVIAAIVAGALASAGVAAHSPRAFAAPRAPWGDPDLQGAFTNSDESLIPIAMFNPLRIARAEEAAAANRKKD